MTSKTASFRSDYRAPEFRIQSVDLTFHLHDTATRVRSHLKIKPLTATQELVLHGEALTLIAIALNGDPLASADYTVSDTNLTVKVPAEPFELTIETQLNPLANKALEGLYKSGGAFCTQCEAEGFRRITYYLDRPDILSVFTTTVVGHQQQFPYLLSNGNAVDSGVNADGT